MGEGIDRMLRERGIEDAESRGGRHASIWSEPFTKWIGASHRFRRRLSFYPMRGEMT